MESTEIRGQVKYRVGLGEMNRPHKEFVIFDLSLVFRFPAKIRAALRVGAAPAPRRVAGSLSPNSEIWNRPRSRRRARPRCIGIP
jgi:hypothetical protein